MVHSHLDDPEKPAMHCQFILLSSRRTYATLDRRWRLIERSHREEERHEIAASATNRAVSIICLLRKERDREGRFLCPGGNGDRRNSAVRVRRQGRNATEFLEFIFLNCAGSRENRYELHRMQCSSIDWQGSFRGGGS